MEKQAVITATDLCIGYRTHKEEKKVHEHLSFELYPGELTSLLGANGAGKSTLLRTLSASQPSLAGDLQLLDKPLQHYSEKERSRTIGVVLTDKTQAGGLTVYELVALGRQPHTGFFGRLHPAMTMLIIQRSLECRRNHSQSTKVIQPNFRTERRQKGNDSQSIGTRMSTDYLWMSQPPFWMW